MLNAIVSNLKLSTYTSDVHNESAQKVGENVEQKLCHRDSGPPIPQSATESNRSKSVLKRGNAIEKFDNQKLRRTADAVVLNK